MQNSFRRYRSRTQSTRDLASLQIRGADTATPFLSDHDAKPAFNYQIRNYQAAFLTTAGSLSLMGASCPTVACIGYFHCCQIDVINWVVLVEFVVRIRNGFSI